MKKFTRLFLVSLFALLLLASIVGCGQPSVAPKTAATPVSHSSNTYSNPYGWVGDLHNAAIRDILPQITKPGLKTQPTQAEIAKYVVNYLGPWAVVDIGDVRKVDEKSVIDSLRTSKLIVTNDGTQAVSELFSTIGKELLLGHLLSEIERLEQDASTKLSGSELKAVRMLYAVAWYSAQLWAPRDDGGQDFGSQLRLEGKINWWGILKADAVGAGAGALGGAAAGGVGVGPGAAIGGAVASIVEVCDQMK